MVFVTVGTTYFDELIQEVDSPSFHALLASKGFTHLLMQIGNASYVPKYASLQNDKASATSSEHADDHDSSASRKGGLDAQYYRFKPHISSDVSSSSLVISHAGSGSILEVLEMGKPLVVVVNERLMHNHQAELADALSSPGYLLSCTPDRLVRTVERDLTEYVRERKTMNLNTDNVRPVVNSIMEKAEAKLKDVERCMIVLGSGGHTSEMFRLLEGFVEPNEGGGKAKERAKGKAKGKGNAFIAGDRVYVLANTDTRSGDKIKQFEQDLPHNESTVVQIPRSRHVGQSYISSIFTTLISIWFCLGVVWRHRPRMLLCNGPGTCIPIIVAAWIFSLLCGRICTIVYIESVARVRGLSLSGKLAKYFADLFVVQWPQLVPVGPRDAVVQNLFFNIPNDDTRMHTTPIPHHHANTNTKPSITNRKGAATIIS
eukprot:TRINITY_DN13849_c0_g1_i1.p1 TRINITY_DN13849_c0_g1~~TRINITY_DN13849_c0_g1_i1.p1  ORF type:complete len:461 (+),score=90.86 TRINITY_DN13849_c0_g1_i1:96-1385(+)